MCGTVMRGADALPGSKATSRAKGSYRKLGDLGSDRNGGAVAGQRGAVADDERAREVGPRHSSDEADEQSGTASCGAICGGAERSGAGGAKGGDQGECGPAKHAPDAEPGKRVTGAGTHTQSGNGKEEGEVHHALPPHRHRSLGGGVLRTCAERSPRRGSDDVEGLRGRHRAQSRGFARPGPPRSVSGTAEPAGLHSQAGWTAASARGRSP